jgi:signal transduction histidine kinase
VGFFSFFRSRKDARPSTTPLKAPSESLLERRPTDLNQVVAAMISELERMVGERITVSATLAAHPVIVSSNAAAVEHMLLSVVLNAREAIGDGGRLTIETVRIDPRDDPMAFGPPSHGKGCLVVTHTGIGSLGLATVAFTANQLDGRLVLESRPATGTRISLTFPLSIDAD